MRAALLGGPGASGLNLASSKLEVAAVLTAAGACIDAALAQYRLARSVPLPMTLEGMTFPPKVRPPSR